MYSCPVSDGTWGGSSCRQSESGLHTQRPTQLTYQRQRSKPWMRKTTLTFAIIMPLTILILEGARSVSYGTLEQIG